MSRTFVGLLVVLLGLYAAWAALLWTQQRAILFPGAGVRVATAKLPPNGRRVELPASFGTVRAVLLAAERSDAAPAVIWLHGNYEFVDESLDYFDALTQAGAHVMLVEYPGYGGSDGAPSFASLAESTRAAFDWLGTQPSVDAARISVFGRSIGTGPACELLRDRTPRAVVLMSPFGAIADFAAERLVPRPLVRDPFDNVARVAAYAGPVLVLHGRHDDIIPFAHGERVADAAPDATLAPLDCGHNDCPFLDDPAFAGVVLQFLRSAGAL